MRKMSYTPRTRKPAKDTTPRCMFGQPTDSATGKAPGWTAEDHCEFCWRETRRLRGQPDPPAKLSNTDARKQCALFPDPDAA